MRQFTTLAIATLLALVVAAPALAARPTIVSFEFDDAADSAFFSSVCGFPVTSESSGHVVFHNDKHGAVIALANWNINNWLYSANGSYHLLDAGPDMVHTTAGTSYFTVIGRSLTLRTVIGRVEAISTQVKPPTTAGSLVTRCSTRISRTSAKRCHEAAVEVDVGLDDRDPASCGQRVRADRGLAGRRVGVAMLAFGWKLIVPGGVNVAMPLVYRWEIRHGSELMARYTGSATDERRPLTAYARNVNAMRAGKGWHGATEAHRWFHGCLNDATSHGTNVTLTFLANAPDRSRRLTPWNGRCVCRLRTNVAAVPTPAPAHRATQRSGSAGRSRAGLAIPRHPASLSGPTGRSVGLRHRPHGSTFPRLEVDGRAASGCRIGPLWYVPPRKGTAPVLNRGPWGDELHRRKCVLVPLTTSWSTWGLVPTSQPRRTARRRLALVCLVRLTEHALPSFSNERRPGLRLRNDDRRAWLPHRCARPSKQARQPSRIGSSPSPPIRRSSETNRSHSRRCRADAGRRVGCRQRHDHRDVDCLSRSVVQLFRRSPAADQRRRLEQFQGERQDGHPRRFALSQGTGPLSSSGSATTGPPRTTTRP